MSWDWVSSNLDRIGELLAFHLYLALVPVALGLLVALPVGFLVARWGKLYGPMLASSAILFSIPSLALS